MSLESWKEEFYPVPANSKTAKKRPLTHSLRKWQGLRAENLAKHGLGYGEYCIVDMENRQNRFPIDIETCALCQVYYVEYSGSPCANCPLAQARGGIPCDDSDPCQDEENDPYYEFIRNHNPEPMIKFLEMAAKIHK